MVQLCKGMVNNMRSTAFWKALGTGAAAPAMLYAPRQDYMIYAALDTVPVAEDCQRKSVTVCSQAGKTVKVISHEHKR